MIFVAACWLTWAGIRQRLWSVVAAGGAIVLMGVLIPRGEIFSMVRFSRVMIIPLLVIVSQSPLRSLVGQWIANTPRFVLLTLACIAANVAFTVHLVHYFD